MDEIQFLRKKYFVTPDKMVCEVKDNFTFDEVVKLLREYTEYQAQSHKHGVMQAEGLDGAKGATVGNGADGQSGCVDKCKVCGVDISSDNFYGLCKLHW